MTRTPGSALTIGWLYPDLMNIYGDRGNIVTLAQRARWRGLEARVLELGKGATAGIDEVDVFFFGGGQDREQALVYDDLLETKAAHLAAAVQGGAAMLAVCGGYQFLGHYYEAATGQHLPGIALIDVRTEAGGKRCIGARSAGCCAAGATTAPTARRAWCAGTCSARTCTAACCRRTRTWRT